MKSEVSSEEAIERWDLNAERWAEEVGDEGGPHREVLLNPVIFDLMGEVEGHRILDAGCGEGYLSRMLASKGASVVGVDYSKALLWFAKERTSPELCVEYLHGSCEKLNFLADESFDKIVSNMVMGDLADLGSALGEMYRLLRPRGCFVFTILHPCFGKPLDHIYVEEGLVLQLPTSSGRWKKDKDGKALYWSVDKYFEEGPYEVNLSPGNASGKRVKDLKNLINFHRTLTTYFRAIKRAGFIIDDLVEPLPNEEKLTKYPWFVEDFRIPNFMAFKIKKIRQTLPNA